MALIGINDGGWAPRGERKPSVLEQIAMGVDVASKVLGAGLGAYKTVAIDKPGQEAANKKSEAEAKYYDAKALAEPGDMNLDRALKRSQIEANIASTQANTTAKTRENALPSLSVGQKTVDEEFAKEYTNWALKGGYSNLQKNIDQLNTAKQALEHSKDISGPTIGLIPLEIRKRSHPHSASVQNDIEDYAQSSLKETLGAQFTQREGEMILRRAFDPAMNEKENARRLEKFITTLDRIKEAKQAAAEWFRDKGTMQGYRGQLHFGLQDFGIDPKKEGIQSPGVNIAPQGAAAAAPAPAKPPIVKQNGHTYTLNPQTGAYESD